MFFHSKFLIIMIPYILASGYMTLTDVVYNPLISVDVFRDMDIYTFLLGFYKNFVESQNFGFVSSSAKWVAFVWAFGKVTLATLLINFSYLRVRDHTFMILLTYFTLVPVCLYFFNVYLIQYDYVTMHYNGILFFMAFIFGFSIAQSVSPSKGEDFKLTITSIFMAILGLILLYKLAMDEYQSTQMATVLFMLLMGGISFLISTLIDFLMRLNSIKKHKKEREA